MRVAVPIAFALFCAGAALAQAPGQLPSGHVSRPVPEACKQLEPASVEFVETFKTTGLALRGKDWAGAIGGAALARPHATSRHQESALIQVEVVAYHELRNQAAMVELMERAIANECTAIGVRKNYQQMLDKIVAGGTPWPEQQ
jgi:hypothetical protein